MKQTEEIEWVTVDEALPEEGKDVLITFEEGRVFLGYRFRGEWHCQMFPLADVDDVIAWAHMPRGWQKPTGDVL